MLGGDRICRNVVSDITERKAIQEKLRYTQSLLQTAGTMAQVGGWAIRLPHNDLMWSDEIFAILDFPKGTVPPLSPKRFRCIRRHRMKSSPAR